nr:MAG TPA: DIL domain protein [Caudoviricetes sp.]
MIYGREKAKVPVWRIDTPMLLPKHKNDDVSDVFSYTFNTVFDWVREQDKRTEEQILKEITDWAKEHNISTVYLIDEEFVKTALLNEIERRNKERMRAMTKITELEKKCGTFREFCKINGLNDGDYYSALDYIDYCNGLTRSEILKITQKYEPNFKSEDLGF